MNKVILAGRITRDIELKVCGSGTEVANLSVAVDRRAKKGEEKKTDFIECTVWGKTAAFVAQYFHKGDGIVLSGRLESNKWTDNEGNNRTSWGVTVEDVEFPMGKSSGNPGTSSDTTTPEFETVSDGDDLPF